MADVVELARDTVADGRPFTAPAHTAHETAVMQEMLERLRAVARGWLESPPAGSDFLVLEPDAAGLRTWIRVPDRTALLDANELTAVGFFGRSRTDVDQTVIHELEAEVVDTLERVPGVLSYFDLELPAGGYGNLILCRDSDVPVRWRDHELHRRAVELTPRHYHSVRLHTGVVRSPLLGHAELDVRRTRYYDFDCEPAWLAVRQLP